MSKQEAYISSGFIENAAHEAGHAVIGHVLGLRVEAVEVYQRAEEGGGAVSFAEHDYKEERSAIMHAAGAAAVAEAQDRLRKELSRARWVDGVEPVDHVFVQWPDPSEDDKRAIREYLTANVYYGVTGKREYRRIQAEARRLVRENWSAITGVMHSLSDASQDTRDGSTGKIDRAAFLKAIEGKIEQ